MTPIFENKDQTLVFFDWLSRFTESDAFDSLSDAERRVLWDMEATLESTLSEVVAGDYKEAIAAASLRVVGTAESE